jgi:hypothetical protein
MEVFVGPPTISVAVALMLQYTSATGIKTSNQANALLAQAIHVARILRLDSLDKEQPNMFNAWLYLTMVFSDQ